MQALIPALNYPPELLLQAQGVRLAFFDVDGVLLVCPERRAIHRIEFPLAGAALADDTEAS